MLNGLITEAIKKKIVEISCDGQTEKIKFWLLLCLACGNGSKNSLHLFLWEQNHQASKFFLTVFSF